MRTIFGIRFFIMLVVATGFLSNPATAQSITISEELALRNDYAYTILGWVDKNMLLFRDKGHAFFIQAFDEELHLKWERELYLSDSRADIIGIVAHDDRFHIIYGTRQKGSYAVLHKAFSNDVTLVDTSTITRFENAFMIPRFLMRESEDKSKVLLYKQENNSLQLYSYDLHTLQILWAKSINFEGTQLEEDYSPLIINNYGDFFLPMRSERTQQKIQYLHVLSSAPNVIQVIHDTIRLGDIQILDIFPVYDHIQRCLVVTGLCGERNTSRAKGFYFVRYHDDMRAEMSLLQFDESLLTEVNGRGVAVSKGLSDFTVQRVALRQDGGVVIIAELIKEFSRRSSLPMQRDNGAYAREGWVDYYLRMMARCIRPLCYSRHQSTCGSCLMMKSNRKIQ